MPLLVHGETPGADVDVFDREAHFIDAVLIPLLERYPKLPVVFEHITTARAAEFVRAAGGTAGAVDPSGCEQHLGGQGDRCRGDVQIGADGQRSRGQIVHLANNVDRGIESLRNRRDRVASADRVRLRVQALVHRQLRDVLAEHLRAVNREQQVVRA